MIRHTRYRFLLENENNVIALENKKNWAAGQEACTLCHMTAPGPTCLLDVANICVTCAESIFRHLAQQEEIAAWHFSRLIEAISARGRLRHRFAVLTQHRHAGLLVQKQQVQELARFHQHLVDNLGYVDDHPLAICIQQLAINACIETGTVLLPRLLSTQDHEPDWQYTANVIAAASLIDPLDPLVQTFLEDHAGHPNAQIRQKVALGLSGLQANWARRLLTELEKDSDQGVRHVASQNLNALDSDNGQPDYAPASDNKTISDRETLRLKEMETVIDETYRHDVLKVLLKTYLADFFDESHFAVKGRFNPATIKKAPLVKALAKVFVRSPLLESFYEMLPRELKLILNVLTWEGGYHNVQIFQTYLKTPLIIETDTSGYGGGRPEKAIDPQYILIPYKKEYIYHWSHHPDDTRFLFYLPDPMRMMLKKVLPKPKNYDLVAIEEDHVDSPYRFEDKDRIIGNIHLLCAYIDQGHLRYTKDGGRVMKSSINKMIKDCYIDEFYNEKELSAMRCELFIDFLQNTSSLVSPNGPEGLRQLFDFFFHDPLSPQSFQIKNFLSHIGGRQYLRGSYGYDDPGEMTVRLSVYELLKRLPVGRWLAVADLLSYCRFRDIDLDIVDRDEAKHTLTVRLQTENSERWAYNSPRPEYISGNHYHPCIIEPMFKGVMFLLASFGIVDMAYRYPYNNQVCKTNATYLSLFDGLEYIRLTALGAYIVGLSPDYQATLAQEEGRVLLDDNHLHIHLDGTDRLKKMVLEKIGEKITNKLYKVTHQSFLKECYSHEDILSRVDLFKNHIAAKPPQNWENFLDDILEKVDPLIPASSFLVFKLKEKPELIKLISQDEILKKTVLKADGYHVLIPSEALSKVKKRLETFGYFIDPSIREYL